jgi:predicted permease
MNWTIDYVVGPGYLQTMGIPLQRGRFFTAQDNERAPLVVVIDDVFARKYFGGENPLGKGIVFNDIGKRAEIVGVVGHVNQWGLDSDDTQQLRAQVYIPCMQMPDAYMPLVPSGIGVVVRAANNTAGLLDSIRSTSRQMSSQQVLYGAQTMSGIISDSLAARRFSMILLGIFAALALLLASVGIYGVISYLVGQRTQEIGIRMAMGASAPSIMAMVFAQGMRQLLIGLAIGLAASFALTHVLAALVVVQVKPADPATYLTVALVLILAGAIGSAIPARRAIKVDPIVALRYQ